MRPAIDSDVIYMPKHPLALPFRPALSKGSLPKDLSFPFGHPQCLDYSKLDPIGIDLIKELNKRPWCQTVSYCSGHPMDRPEDENTPWSSKATWKGKNRWDLSVELEALSRQYRGHRLTKDAFHSQSDELLNLSRTRFHLNLNIYVMEPFTKWLRIVHVIYARTFMKFPVYRLPEVIFNPVVPTLNYSINCGYFGTEHRVGMHKLWSEALRHVPI